MLVAFPGSWLALELDDTDGNPRTAERPETAADVWRRESRAVALIDGPMFRPADGLPYDRSQQSALDYRYLDTARRIDVPTRYPERGATLSVTASGETAMMRGAAELREATFAVQGYPEILRAGENVANPNRDADDNKRAALVRLSDGRVGFAISRSGVHALGELLRRARAANGATIPDAVYTDGGGSMALALRGAGGRDLVAENMTGRRLPVFLLAVPPVGGEGTTGRRWWAAVGGAAGLAALIAGVEWWRRQTSP